jgi:hypothetical protein
MNSQKKALIFPLLAGLLIGLLVGAKYTLLAIYPALLLDDIIDRKMPVKRIITKNILTIVSIFLGLGLASLPLLNPDIRHGFSNVLAYLNHYASLPPMSMALLRSGLKQSAIFFGDNYSILLVTAIAIAVVYSVRPGKTEAETNIYSFLRFSFIMALFLFFTVAVEKKFGEYHFSRIYVPLSILASFGFIIIYDRIHRWWQTAEVYGRVNLMIVVFVCFIFSPLPRWLSLAQLPIVYVINHDKYDAYFERDEGSALHRKQHIAVANHINANNKENKKVIVMSTGACVINHFLNTSNISRFAQSQFYFSSFRIPEWDKLIMTELAEANWLVVQTNDRHLNIYGHNLSSSESLSKEKPMNDYVQTHYALNKEIGYYKIYLRK